MQVSLVVAGKVKGVDIAFLPVAINAPVALLKAHRVPGDLQVDHETAGDLQTNAFRDGIRADQDAQGIAGIVEGIFDALALFARCPNDPRNPLRILVGTDTVSEGISLQI